MDTQLSDLRKASQCSGALQARDLRYIKELETELEQLRKDNKVYHVMTDTLAEKNERLLGERDKVISAHEDAVEKISRLQTTMGQIHRERVRVKKENARLSVKVDELQADNRALMKRQKTAVATAVKKAKKEARASSLSEAKQALPDLRRMFGQTYSVLEALSNGLAKATGEELVWPPKEVFTRAKRPRKARTIFSPR